MLLPILSHRALGFICELRARSQKERFSSGWGALQVRERPFLPGFRGFPRHFLEVGLRMPQGVRCRSASKREILLRKKSVGPKSNYITMRIKDLRISRGLSGTMRILPALQRIVSMAGGSAFPCGCPSSKDTCTLQCFSARLRHQSLFRAKTLDISRRPWVEVSFHQLSIRPNPRP